MKVKEINGCYARQDDGCRCGKALQYVVCILNDNSHHQATERLKAYDKPDDPVIAV